MTKRVASKRTKKLQQFDNQTGMRGPEVTKRAFGGSSNAKASYTPKWAKKIKQFVQSNGPYIWWRRDLQANIFCRST
eukprot:CAMPEP_0171764972 /NCGR_PEP_ID=MMETSP0991-20121206/50331_1 /TAXON_ID=483369 /ORGANISM="non described non described, Strain CCMP2098" /LENGTH=76 /DNA_ID=CAMNT_0012369251 /DNA_START=53 /DNA_END=280 /DNA_ORIENTATION=-